MTLPPSLGGDESDSVSREVSQQPPTRGRGREAGLPGHSLQRELSWALRSRVAIHQAAAQGKYKKVKSKWPPGASRAGGLFLPRGN